MVDIIGARLRREEALTASSGTLSSIRAVDADGRSVLAAPGLISARYNVGLLGADPEQTLRANTDIMQAAIESAADDGRGEVFVPFKGDGVYKVTASASTQQVGSIASGPSIVHGPASTNVALLLRSGVHLVLDDGVVIENQDPSLTVVGLYKMAGGGIHGGCLRSLWRVDNQVGVGHGIFSFFDVSPNDDPMWDLDIEDVEICNVGSYCFGLNLGFMKNNKLRRLWGHDNGADVVDFKARPKTDGTVPYGNTLDTLLAERYGRRTGVTSVCAADIRGALVARAITARAQAMTLASVAVVSIPNIVSSESFIEGLLSRRNKCRSWTEVHLAEQMAAESVEPAPSVVPLNAFSELDIDRLVRALSLVVSETKCEFG